MTPRITGKIRLFAAASGVALAAAATFAAPAMAQWVTVSGSPQDQTERTVRVELLWSAPVGAQVEQTADELVIRVDRPLVHAALAAAATRISRWVGGVFVGYDSLVLKLTPGTVATVATSGARVTITLRAAAPTSSAQARPGGAGGAEGHGAQDAARRLRMLKATLLWTTGDVWQAGQVLQGLRQQGPDDARLQAAHALVEARLSRWRRAAALMQLASADAGTSGRGRLPVAGSAHAPVGRGRFVSEQQDNGVARTELRADGHFFIADGLRVVVDYRFARLSATPSTAGVALLPDEDAHHRAAVGMRFDAMQGSWLSADVRATSQTTGAVVQAELWDPLGGTRIVAGLDEPRWELPAFTAVGAIRDGVGITRSFRSVSGVGRLLRGQVQARFSGFLERWRTAEGDASLTDLLLTGSVRYVSWRDRPRWWAQYAVMRLDVRDRTSAPGGTDRLASLLTSSQVHAATAGARLTLWRWLAADAFGGYSLSSPGGGAAQFGAGLSWTPPIGFTASADFARVVTPSSFGLGTQRLTLAAGGRF